MRGGTAVMHVCRMNVASNRTLLLCLIGMESKMSPWQQWLHHPERSSMRNAIFQIHLWTGAIASIYVLLLSISGSMVVFRNLLATSFPSIERLVKLHTSLSLGPIGRIV